MTLQGVGAALSSVVGGYAAQLYGYEAAFGVLGAIAGCALLIWIFSQSFLREAGVRVSA